MKLSATLIDKAKSIGMWMLLSLGLFETWGVFRHFFSATFLPDSVLSNSSLLGIVALLPVIFAIGYVYKNGWPLETVDAKRFLGDTWLKISTAVFILYLAFFMGMAFTVLGFGQRGPFGAVMEGIKGLSLPIDEKYWPVVFFSGVALIIGQALSMYAGLVRKK